MYFEKYPLLRGNAEEFDFSIPLLRMIEWIIYNNIRARVILNIQTGKYTTNRPGNINLIDQIIYN